jgi:mannosyltransferase
MAEPLVHHRDAPDAEPPAGAGRRAGGIEWVIAAEVLLALVLGLIALNRSEFFPDEAYTWSSVNRSIPSMISVIVRQEAFQVLHTLLLWPINAISDSSFALRLPSVLCFAATVPAVWLLARRCFGERAGWLAGLLLVLNAFALEYAQEARSYTMAMMFVAWAGVGLEREVREPTRRSRLLWVLASIAAVWAHGMAVFAIAAQIGALLVLPRERWRAFVLDAVVIGVCVVPVVLAPLLQVDHGESYAGVTSPDLTTFRLAVWTFAGRSVFALVPYGIAGAAALWAAVKAVRAHARSGEAFTWVFLFAWLVFPPAILLLVSFVDPIWVVRYAIPSLVPLVVLVAYGIGRVRPQAAFAGAVVVTVAAASWGIVRWYGNTGYADFDGIADTIQAEHRPGDAIALVTDRSRMALEFELRHRAALRREVPPAYPAVAWGGFEVGDQTGDTMPASAVQAMAATYDRIWLISGFYDPDEQVAIVTDRMRIRYRLVRTHEYDGNISLSLLERAGP